MSNNNNNNAQGSTDKKYSGGMYLANEELHCFANNYGNPNAKKSSNQPGQQSGANSQQQQAGTQNPLGDSNQAQGSHPNSHSNSPVKQQTETNTTTSSQQQQYQNNPQSKPNTSSAGNNNTKDQNGRSNPYGLNSNNQGNAANQSNMYANAGMGMNPQGYYNMNMYPNQFQAAMFPMVTVPMNMPMMNMMNFSNMMYNQMNPTTNKGMYDNSFNEFMLLPLDQVLDEFGDKITDQQGCKQLQARIENERNNSKFFSAIFDLILQKFKDYSNDQFANYLCQKIVELSSGKQLVRIVDVLIPDLLEMSKANHGTRVVQKVIENILDQNLIDLILSEFQENVVDLVMDSNGNHVIQKCLSYFDAENLGFMYEEIMELCSEVATHKHGCCVLQRCIDYCNEDQIKMVIGGILEHTDVLINDQYGNYVIQYILELQGYNEYKIIIGESLNKDIIHYCYQKYSSNVIEKSIKMDIKIVFNHFMKVLGDKRELRRMICDQFGNYVIQTALLRNRNNPKIFPVLNSIKSISSDLSENEIGAKVLQKLSRVFDFWGGDEVKLEDYKEREGYHRRKGNRKPYYKKKGGYGNNNRGGYGNGGGYGGYTKAGSRNGVGSGNGAGKGNGAYNMYQGMGMDGNNMHQGYVNMNMNLNFSVNLNYQNQSNDGGAGAGNRQGGANGENWD